MLIGDVEVVEGVVENTIPFANFAPQFALAA